MAFSRSKLTTILVFGMLGAAAAIQNQCEVSDKSLARRDNPFQNLDTCPALEAYNNPAQPLNLPIIDSNFISNLIINPLNLFEKIKYNLGLSHPYQNIINVILQLHQSNQNIRNFMDLCFNHLNLKISIDSADESKKQGLTSGGYDHFNNLIRLPDNFSEEEMTQSSSRLLRYFRFAALNSMQQILGKSQTFSVRPYHPNIEKEKYKVLGMLKKGDQALKALEDLLDREDSKLLSAIEQKKLDSLREKFKKSYSNLYTTIFTVTTSATDLTGYTAGSYYRIEGVGKVLLKRAYLTNKGTVNLFVKREDPLRIATTTILNQINLVKAHFPESEYLENRDAYLHGATPQDMIEYFYPELSEYTNNLIISSLNADQQLKASPLSSFDFAHAADWNLPNVKAQLVHLTNPDLFDPNYADEYFRLAMAAAQRGNIDEAKAGYHRLIQNKQLVAVCYTNLAIIEHNQKNFKNAVRYYDLAKKHGRVFSEEDKRMYEYSKDAITVKKGSQHQKRPVGIQLAF